MATRKSTKYVVVHTAAYDGDCSAETIKRWHKSQGWRTIGYHYVIRYNGNIEIGRTESEIGAHVRGLNSKSIGICCSGHGDIRDFTDAQYESLYNLLMNIAARFQIDTDNIIGHRECYKILGVPVRKTCPGKRVSMSNIRKTFESRIPTISG